EARACANSAAELNLDPGCRAHAADHGQIDRHSLLGAVEIDDVQRASAEGAVVLRELDGIDGVTRLLLEVALQETDAASVAQVDGWYQFHLYQPITRLSSENYRESALPRATSVPGETACRRSCLARRRPRTAFRRWSRRACMGPAAPHSCARSRRSCPPARRPGARTRRAARARSSPSGEPANRGSTGTAGSRRR